jgi:hypothetical protein
MGFLVAMETFNTPPPYKKTFTLKIRTIFTIEQIGFYININNLFSADDRYRSHARRRHVTLQLFTVQNRLNMLLSIHLYGFQYFLEARAKNLIRYTLPLTINGRTEVVLAGQ